MTSDASRSQALCSETTPGWQKRIPWPKFFRNANRTLLGLGLRLKCFGAVGSLFLLMDETNSQEPGGRDVPAGLFLCVGSNRDAVQIVGVRAFDLYADNVAQA